MDNIFTDEFKEKMVFNTIDRTIKRIACKYIDANREDREFREGILRDVGNYYGNTVDTILEDIRVAIRRGGIHVSTPISDEDKTRQNKYIDTISYYAQVYLEEASDIFVETVVGFTS